MKVKFIDVGSYKKTWESNFPAANFDDIDYSWLYSQVKKHGFIMSKEIDFIMLNGSERDGFITAGFHTIGRFELREDD